MKKIMCLLSTMMFIGCAVTHYSLNIKTDLIPIPAALDATSEDWDEVTVAPLVLVDSSVQESTFENSGYDFDKWVEAQRFAVSGEIQDVLVNYDYKWKNIRVIDPQDVPHLFAEIHRSMAIGDISMLQVGNMLGATHVVIARVNRGLQGRRVQDTYHVKLIETESSTVLASQTFFRP